MRKVVGVTCSSKGIVNLPYLEAIRDSGASPIIIPAGDSENTQDLISRIDGLLVTGGKDLHPCNYGEPAHPNLGVTEPDRDAEELALVTWARTLDMPILGICRGMQVLNVALGGTLWQDIPSMLCTDITHMQTKERNKVQHKVYIRPESKLHLSIDSLEISTNSYHHQAVRELGEGLVVDAVAPDGLIESISLPSTDFCCAVQWHPEETFKRGERSRNLFKAFVASMGR